MSIPTTTDAIEGATYDDEQGGYKFPTDATLPTITFAVGDTQYTLNPQDLAFGDAGDGYTFGGVQSRGNMDFDIFGDVFLKIAREDASRRNTEHDAAYTDSQNAIVSRLPSFCGFHDSATRSACATDSYRNVLKTMAR